MSMNECDYLRLEKASDVGTYVLSTYYNIVYDTALFRVTEKYDNWNRKVKLEREFPTLEDATQCFKLNYLYYTGRYYDSNQPVTM